MSEPGRFQPQSWAALADALWGQPLSLPAQNPDLSKDELFSQCFAQIPGPEDP